MKIKQLLQTLTPYYNYSGQGDDIDITAIEFDSRLVVPGSLFVCLEGAQTDGHRYAEQAVQQGAVAILAQKELSVGVPTILVPDTRRALALISAVFYANPTKRLRLIGVTGTNGKTTVTHLLEQIFEREGKLTGRIGTVGMKIGHEIKDVKNTTPESAELQKAFAHMVEADCEYAFMEVSSHAIQMGRVRGCSFQGVIFTNLTQDHLDYHGTMEEYKRAKGLVFAQLGNDHDSERPKYAILNADDPASDYYREVTPVQVITYGIDQPQADVRATNIRMNSQGTIFTVESFKGKEEFKVGLLGKFNVYNLLSAIAVGLAEGLSLADMSESLARLQGVRGRMEPVDAGQDFTVLVDYAHTPDSLENVLATVQEFAEQKIICVVGCGGDRDRTKRPIMAQISCQYADVSIFTSDNPRSENPEQILKDMVAGVEGDQAERKYTTIVDRRQAIFEAIAQANVGDVILIAGKGHETYQQIQQQRVHFDDREVALEALQKVQKG